MRNMDSFSGNYRTYTELVAVLGVLAARHASLLPDFPELGVVYRRTCYTG